MGKTIDMLTKPFKYADEQILRYYSKPVKKWEDRGHSRYSLASGLNLASGCSVSSSLLFSLGLKYLAQSHVVFSGTSTATSIFGFWEGDHTGIKNNGDNFFVEDYPLYLFNKILNSIRTPELITGLSFMGKGGLDIYNYFSNNEPSLLEGVGNVLFGAGLVFNSSAAFVRNSDPKLLDKAPFWKSAYEGTKKVGRKTGEKIGDLLPSPQPLPEPSALSINNYLTQNI